MKKIARTGVDGANFQLKLVGVDANTYMELQEKRNSKGELVATMEIKRGMLYLYINFPRILREDNIRPLSSLDIPQLTEGKHSFIEELEKILVDQWIICNVGNSILKRIECGTTQQVVKGCTCSKVINAINISMCKGTNNLYQSADEKYKYCRKYQYIDTSFEDKGARYILKGYDKTLERRSAGDLEIENHMLRIEIIFLCAAIRKLFQGEITLNDLLRKDNLLKIIREYKRLFKDVIVKKFINPCLVDITNKIFETLIQTGNVTETIAKCKIFIIDEQVLREALKKWNRLKGMAEINARRNADKKICLLRNYELPEGVIKTIQEFEKTCS